MQRWILHSTWEVAAAAVSWGEEVEGAICGETWDTEVEDKVEEPVIRFLFRLFTIEKEILATVIVTLKWEKISYA
uniref:Uncharacterized protein n=1 Tax=Pristionchus pacificus TaxID=54126 RepID=A0A2A6CH97_PRIPA|eukprot:PDM77460.1 hypothetical protein PRIPAC_33190 [Pristionchus pacificus]